MKGAAMSKVLRQTAVQPTGQHQHAEQQQSLVDQRRKAAAEARTGRGLGSQRHQGCDSDAADAAAECVAAPCGPRLGSSVVGLTNVGVAAILGKPGW